MVAPLYAFSLFLPTIINGLGFSPAKSQLSALFLGTQSAFSSSPFRLTIPPYALACMCTIGLSMVSDRLQIRGPFVMGSSLLAITGYAILYATSPVKQAYIGYAGSILAACGVFPTIPIMLAWSSGNAGASLKKGVVIALTGGVGNFGGSVKTFEACFVVFFINQSFIIVFALLSSIVHRILRDSILGTASLSDFCARRFSPQLLEHTCTEGSTGLGRRCVSG